MCYNLLRLYYYNLHLVLYGYYWKKLTASESVLDNNTGKINLALSACNSIVVIVLQMQSIWRLTLGLLCSLNNKHGLHVGNIRDITRMGVTASCCHVFCLCTVIQRQSQCVRETPGLRTYAYVALQQQKESKRSYFAPGQSAMTKKIKNAAVRLPF